VVLLIFTYNATFVNHDRWIGYCSQSYDFWMYNNNNVSFARSFCYKNIFFYFKTFKSLRVESFGYGLEELSVNFTYVHIRYNHVWHLSHQRWLKCPINLQQKNFFDGLGNTKLGIRKLIIIQIKLNFFFLFPLATNSNKNVNLTDCPTLQGLLDHYVKYMY
jgi:hypothetical protein